MVGTRQLEALVARAAAARAKVVLVGDPAQLPAIAAGGALAGLAARLSMYSPTENHRQAADWVARRLADLRAGRTDQLAETYEGYGRLDATVDVETVWTAGWRRRSGVTMSFCSRAGVIRSGR